MIFFMSCNNSSSNLLMWNTWKLRLQGNCSFARYRWEVLCSNLLRLDLRTSNITLSLCWALWHIKIGWINHLFVCLKWPNRPSESEWVFPRWVMWLLVSLMLYWFSYLCCKVEFSFCLGVRHHLLHNNELLLFNLLTEITLWRYT